MEILEQTPTRLSLRFRPWGIWISGLFFIFIGLPINLIFFLPLSKTNTFSCERIEKNQGNCQLKTSFLLFYQIKNIDLDKLQRAKIDLIKNNSTEKQRVILITTEGEQYFPILLTYHPNIKAFELKAIIAEINDFIKDKNQPYLKVQEGKAEWIGWFICVGLIYVIITLGFWSEVITCCFDKNHGVLIKTRNWLILKIKIEHPLVDIINVEVQETRTRYGQCYRISLVLASGKHLHLTEFSTYDYVSKDKIQKEVNIIIDFFEIGNKNLN